MVRACSVGAEDEDHVPAAHGRRRGAGLRPTPLVRSTSRQTSLCTWDGHHVWGAGCVDAKVATRIGRALACYQQRRGAARPAGVPHRTDSTAGQSRSHRNASLRMHDVGLVCDPVPTAPSRALPPAPNGLHRPAQGEEDGPSTVLRRDLQ